MMRKNLHFGTELLLGLLWIAMIPNPCFPGQADQEQPVGSAGQEPASIVPQPVIKTYSLKHIKPEELLHATRLFYDDASFSGNMVTVKLWNTQIPKFEEMLRKLDVERKMVQFKIFVVVASREQTPSAKPQSSGSSPTKPVTPVQMASKYSGKPVSMKFKEGDLRDVILYLAEFAGLNVVFDPDVRGSVTCNLTDVPWDQALDIVLIQANMGKVIDGKFLRVAPVRILSPEKGEEIDNKELKRVLDELKALWNFKTYEVDGPSFLTAVEGSGPNNFKLVTNRQLNLVVSNAKVIGEEPGRRMITIEQLKLTGMTNFVDYTFVDTHDATLKEKGYLVAGVSGFGSATKALILVISAEIK
jgi:type II secretory pathway component GspD/PulD (secretin)